MNSFEIEVGRLLCGKIRDYLERCIFKGMQINYYEGKGFLSRTFVIKGSAKDVREIAHDLIKFLEALA